VLESRIKRRANSKLATRELLPSSHLMFGHAKILFRLYCRSFKSHLGNRSAIAIKNIAQGGLWLTLKSDESVIADPD
jgi:hypothetical protein